MPTTLCCWLLLASALRKLLSLCDNYASEYNILFNAFKSKCLLVLPRVANDAESCKTSKYQSLGAMYRFTPIAVETIGALGEEASTFFRDLGRRITAVTTEPRSLQFLLQQLSVTIQRGNTACVLGNVPSSFFATRRIFLYLIQVLFILNIQCIRPNLC